VPACFEDQSKGFIVLIRSGYNNFKTEKVGNINLKHWFILLVMAAHNYNKAFEEFKLTKF